jgi:hypothetical protein
VVSTVKDLAEVLNGLIGHLLDTCDDEANDLPQCARCDRLWCMRDRLAAKELLQATPEELGQAALRGETHKHEIAKLKLESDRRARRVAERMLARCQAEVIGYPYISDTQMSGLRWMMDGINIEALVDESKL